MKDVLASKDLIMDAIKVAGLPHRDEFEMEDQNLEYEGFVLTLDDRTYRSRRARKTPNKKGYFTVFWRKGEDDRNRPYTLEECTDRLIITVLDQGKKGQFVFPKKVMALKGIVTTGSSKGKMAMRVYPDWVTGLNPTARKAQAWQSEYFMDLSERVDGNLIRSHYLGKDYT
ncbi:MepB family protein [Rossellomorea marisflavi]|uniref:MepB family protein n=1 Tax=Rossellomorea marisflavi TaxID=189381 RepID=UPI00345B1367